MVKSFKEFVNEGLSESTHYHSVWHHHGGEWKHHFDADNKEDARAERDSIKNNGEKAKIITVHKQRADWRNPEHVAAARQRLNSGGASQQHESLDEEYTAPTAQHHEIINKSGMGSNQFNKKSHLVSDHGDSLHVLTKYHGDHKDNDSYSHAVISKHNPKPGYKGKHWSGNRHAAHSKFGKVINKLDEDTVDNLIYHANHPDPKKAKKYKKKLQAYLDGVKEKISAAKGVHKW